MASTTRDIMTGGVACVQDDESVLDAACTTSRLGVGVLPICGDDDRLKGMLTDRDVVVEVLAEGKGPSSTKAAELAEGEPVTIDVDDSVGELVRMAEHETPGQVVSVVRGVDAD